MAKPNAGTTQGTPTILNRRARHDYEILNTYEAGIMLAGAEVKSVLRGKVNLAGAFCRFVDGELWLMELDIAPYEMATAFVPDRRRRRKLLMHRREIHLIRRRSEERGLALIPTKVYFKNRRVKVEIAIARGKRAHDKREAIAKKDALRESRRRDL